jgi:signal transduction histidine kinase/ActR/RegA family two-component response regulator
MPPTFDRATTRAHGCAGENHLREQWLGLLFDHVSDGIMVSADAIIQAINRPLLELSGYHPGELNGHGLDTLLPGMETHLLSGDGAEWTHATLRHRDHRLLDVDITCIQAAVGSHDERLWLVRDQSERKRIEAQLLKTRQLESIAALSGGIAHDYNNLLAAIMGNISLAQSQADSSSRLFQYLEEAMDASLLAKDLTQKLITFSRGGAPVTRTVAVAPLVTSATEFTLSGSNVKHTLAFPDDLWPVQVDANQIGQAIHNVVMNAREAMPSGGIIRLHAANVRHESPVAGLSPGDFVRLEIQDGGLGIPTEHLPRVFDPYFTTKSAGTDKGLGLGLSICHSIISQHGGAITVNSLVGQGTTVTIWLPAAHCVVEHPHEDAPAIREQTVFGHGRILVMDDEERIREMVGEMLTHLGYEVDFASEGKEAVDKYIHARDAQRPFDAVILDLTIRGGMGGREAIALLRDVDPQVKAIVSSGYSNDPVMSRFREYGFCATAAKPYSIGKISRVLSSVLPSLSRDAGRT